jgi:hypothetical protein
MSSCKKCTADPQFHNFDFVSRHPSGDAIYYTSPAKGKQRSMKEDSIPDYMSHMDDASTTGWVWLIDCSGMESFHMPSLPVLRQFMNIIQERYRFVLKKVYIININWKMHVILNMVKPFMKEEAKERISVIESKLQLVSLGFNGDALKFLSK